MNGCVNKSKPTNNGGIHSVASNSKSGIGEDRNGNTATSTTTQPQYRDLKGTGTSGTQSKSTPKSNLASSSNGYFFPTIDESNPHTQSEGKTITIFNKSDHSILLKPDSTHSSLIFIDDCDSIYRVSIISWTMLETLVIGNRCCSSTKSFEIRNCPQLKSFKVGNHSFKDSSFCIIDSIELPVIHNNE